MRVVYKYGYEYVPSHAIIVHFGEDLKSGGLYVWAEVDTDMIFVDGEYCKMNLDIFGTGQGIINPDMYHISSCVTAYGFVWHLYGRLM